MWEIFEHIFEVLKDIEAEIMMGGERGHYIPLDARQCIDLVRLHPIGHSLTPIDRPAIDLQDRLGFMPSHPRAAHSRTLRAKLIGSQLLVRVETKEVLCYRRQIGAGRCFTGPGSL